MKIDQIAYYATSDEQVEEIKTTFGLQKATWVEDYAVGLGTVYGSQETDIKGKLLFNYDLGIELEILQYDAGSFHWHSCQPHWNIYFENVMLSHVGIHLLDHEDFPSLPESWHLVQELKTTGHTNPYLIENKRKYHYRIFQNGSSPNFLKFIKRIENAA